MGKARVCYYQTSIPNIFPAFQLAIESQAYWTVEDVVEDGGLSRSKRYLLRFDSKVKRDQFRRTHTDERILPARSFAARHAGWKDVSYISITKMPSVEEKYKKRKKNMTYREAANDILEYIKGQHVWMYSPYTFEQAAIALDSRVKHSS